MNKRSRVDIIDWNYLKKKKSHLLLSTKFFLKKVIRKSLINGLKIDQLLVFYILLLVIGFIIYGLYKFCHILYPTFASSNSWTSGALWWKIKLVFLAYIPCLSQVIPVSSLNTFFSMTIIKHTTSMGLMKFPVYILVTLA